MELYLTLHIGEILLNSQYAQCLEQGSPNIFSNDNACIFPVDIEVILL